MAKLTVAVSEQKAPTKVKPVLTSLVRSSDDLALERYRLTTHGGPGHGKTFFAASASKYWPEKLPSKAILKDMLWIAFDAGATRGFREQGINIPNVIDVRWLMTAPKKGEDKPYARTILDAINMVIKQADEMVENGAIEWVVVDTVSMFDKDLNIYWEKNCPTSKQGVPDKFAMYRCIKYAHSTFFDAMALLDAHVHFLCHTKAKIESDDKTQQNKNKAGALPGDNELIPDITGGGAQVYVANVDCEFAMVSTKLLNGGFKRQVYPVGGKGFRGKNRWQLSLTEEEPAHLGTLIGKVETANGK